MTKHIFITGGVVSSLGKGLTSAAIGMILERRGLRVSMQKLDPYINVDPGTMSPYQHGEVYVTDDGAETDLDLGHYERFTHARLTKSSNYTTGKIYQAVIAKERRGDYLGRTVQVIPHITDAIKDAIRDGVGDDQPDVLISEIGGTVGDIESLPFLESIRQFALEKEPSEVMFIHLTLLPYLRASGEMKTKPTQQSVGKLREIGIQPDVLICRTEQPMTDEMAQKISLFCNVRSNHVIEERDVDFSIYEVPVNLVHAGLDRIVTDHLQLPDNTVTDLVDWIEMLRDIQNTSEEVEIAVVGKYIELHDAYKSIYEAFSHAGISNSCKVKIRKVQAEDILDEGLGILDGVDGLLVPGGFGERGIEGKIEAIRWARENHVPFFGICLGMQCAVIEYARNGLGLDGAHTLEHSPDSPHPVIASHSNAHALREHARNLTDEEIRCIAETGGVIGLNFHAPFVGAAGKVDVSRVADHADYLARVGGHGVVALGSDFDGYIKKPTGLEDASKVPALWVELARRGWTDEQIRGVRGANFMRAWRQIQAEG